MYKAYITELKNVRPHSNADWLQLGGCFGNTVCVDLSYTEGKVNIAPFLPSTQIPSSLRIIFLRLSLGMKLKLLCRCTALRRELDICLY